MKIRDLFIEVRVKADRALRDLRMIDRLTKAGAVAMTGLGKTAGRVGKEIEAGAGRAAKGIEKVGKASKDAGGMLGGLASGAVSAFAAVGNAAVGAVKKAVDFETSMAEISKVVDGLKTPTGQTTAEFDKMKESIFGLSKEIAIAPKGFADIIAAAGQAGIAREELSRFAEDAAKMAVAFDISADEAGDAMAKLRTGLGLTQDEVMNLAGTANHLSNNMASAAPEITDVLKRIGAMGGSAGLSGEQVAALGSAMISSGAKTNVAATGIKNFTLAMAAGEAATNRQRGAYHAMGLEAEDVAERFAKGGKETEAAIMDVLSRLKGLDDAKRASTIMQLFGRESMGAIAPLVTQIDNMGKAFDLASDKVAAAGSVQNEFDVRSKTTANALQLLSNRFEVAAIQIGDLFLPALNDALSFLDSPEANAFGDKFVGVIKAGIDKAPEVFATMKNRLMPIIESAIGIGEGFVSGISGAVDTAMALIGPIFYKITEIAQRLVDALGLAGEEGSKFGETIGEDVGATAVTAIEAFSTALDAVLLVVNTLAPVVSVLATIVKGALSASIGVVTDQIAYLKTQFENLTDAFRAFTSGKFKEGFTALGKALLDSLLTPIRIVARALIELADSVPGGAALVPDALREFAGKGAAGGIVGKAKAVGKAAWEESMKKAPEWEVETEVDMEEWKKTGRQYNKTDAKAPAAAGETPAQAAAEGTEDGSGGGGGKGKKGRKPKKEKLNLLDKAVEEAKKKERVLGGTDRAAQQAGPAVTNIYNTFNMEIDARGNEGAAGNVERGAKRGALAGVDRLRGLGSASMMAKAGGGAAAGAG